MWNSELTLAPARERRVDGEAQRDVAGGFGALHQLAHVDVVVEEVRLEPQRASRGRRDLLDRAVRTHRERHERLRRGRGARHGDLTLGIEKPLQRERRDSDRERDALPEHARRERPRARVDQHARHEVPARERIDVVAHRALVARAAGDVHVGARRETLLRDRLELRDREDPGKVDLIANAGHGRVRVSATSSSPGGG